MENCTYTAHACAPEEERIVGKPPARYPGIRIVAAFFILDGFWISYDIARVWLSGQTLEYPVIYGAIPLFSLIGGIGLWRHRGWGRNFGLASSYILLFRGLPYLLSCYAKHDAGYLVGALTSFLLAVSTGSYLYRKPIRIIFPESPASLSFVGFTLALYAFTQHSERTLVDYLWYVLGLAGVIIGVKAVWLTKNALPLLPEEAPQKAQQIHTGHHGWYIVRHWQGEIALPLAYWGNTVLMTLCLMVGFSAAPWADLGIKSLTAFSIVLISLWLVMGATSVWQFVGVWRSATRYVEQGKPRLWGNLARVAVILGLLAGSMEFVSVGIPQFKEYAAMAAGKDALGSYQLRVSRDGTKLEITGPISLGLTAQVRQTLDANRSVRIIHLNSIGGRINEARRLRDLIASRGLTTYTASGCLSACTLAFIGGQTRLIATGAALGFHQYSLPGASAGAFRAEYEKDKQDWLGRGIARAFVNKAFAAPGSQMWKPSHQELFEAGVLTGYPERDVASETGMSPTGLENIEAEWIEKSFKVSPDNRRFAYICHEGNKRFVVVDGQKGKRYDSIVAGPLFSPDSKKVAYAAQSGSERFVVVDGKQEKQYEASGEGLLFSPDSKRLAYAARKINTWFVVVDGKEGERYDAVAAGALVFSRDSKHFAYGAVAHNKQFVVKDGQEGKQYDGVLAEALRFSPDSKHLAYAVQQSNRWFVVVDGKEEKHYYDAIGSLTFSPDSRRLCFAARLADQWAVVVDGREGNHHDSIVAGPVFSPDSRRLAYGACSRNRCFVVGDEKEEGHYDAAGAGLQFSPDSRRLAYTARLNDRWFVVTDGKEEKRYDGIAADAPIFSPDGKHLAYGAAAGNKQFVVMDGKEGKGYDRILPNSMLFSPDSRRLAYAARLANSCYVIVDGKEGKGYNRILAGTPVFTPDSKHVTYGARSPDTWHVVLDAKEQTEYDAIVNFGGGKISFDCANTIHYLALKGGKSSVVQQKIN